jgi:hypothetical protein
VFSACLPEVPEVAHQRRFEPAEVRRRHGFSAMRRAGCVS